jgi:outer membrane immunogenic protein
MRKLLPVAVALAALGSGSAADASDLPAHVYRKAPTMADALYDWSGFYVGLNGGGGWSRSCWDNTSVTPGAVTPEGCRSPSGGAAGGQLGYRLQSHIWVYGIEFQGDWTKFKGSNPSLVPGAGATNQTTLDGFGLLTGQIGYAWSNVLGYLKGGAALTSDRYTGIDTPSGIGFDKASEVRWGGTVGAGLEYSFAPNWSVAAEYDHLFMGSRTVNFSATGTFGIPAGTPSRTDTIRQDVDLASVHVNYRWGGPVISKY